MKTLAIPEMKRRQTNCKEHKYCLVVCFFILETKTSLMACLQGTQDTSILYSEIEERRYQESEGQVR